MPWTKVYSNKEDFERANAESKTPLRPLTFREALHESHYQLLKGDEDIILFGEGVDDAGGVFGSTKGLQEEFGEVRVFDTPLAENGLTGFAIGMALRGLRPILVHMRVDFLLLTMDQIVNHAAKAHYMFGGKSKVPLVIRAIIGRGWGSAAQHSQTFHSMFAHVPGLKVLMPSTPYDAKGMLMSAAYDDNPVIFIEHRHLYEHVGHVPAEEYRVEIGKAAVKREGGDVTIIGVSNMTFEALRAADILLESGIEAEVIDLRSIRPIDFKTIIKSVKKTGRLVIAEPGWRSCSVASEISATVAEEALGYLKAPTRRIHFADTPTPCSPVLEEAYYTGREDIVSAVEGMFQGT